MTPSAMRLQSALADPILRFIAYKRALGRGYDTEASTLQLFDRYLAEQSVLDLEHVTPDLIDAFMASRSRPRPRSYNHLLCTVRRLFEWLVQQGELEQSPVRTRPRRVTAHRAPFIFDPPTVRQLLSVTRALPDNPRASMRGSTYHALFAILYGLGLRVGEACRLQLADVDLDRHLLLIRRTKFYKSRLVPFGPRMAGMLDDYLQVRARRGASQDAVSPVFSFTARGAVWPTTVSQTFHALVPRLGLDVPPGCAPPCLHHLRHYPVLRIIPSSDRIANATAAQESIGCGIIRGRPGR